MESFQIVVDEPSLVVTDPIEALTRKSIGYPNGDSGPRGMRPLDGPKIIPEGTSWTDLTGVYWLTFESLEARARAIASGVFDSLTVVPATNPMQGLVKPKPILMLYHHPTKPLVVGVPRFWGLSTFGLPRKDHRTTGLSVEPAVFRGTLRPLQEQCVRESLKHLSVWGGTTVLADCGYGKTATSIYMAIHMKCKTLILCNRSLLMSQWIDSIRSFSDQTTVGFLQGDSFQKGPDGTVRPKDLCFDTTYFTVASIESVSECASWPKSLLKSFGLVIVDEMHHIAAQSLVHVLPLCPTAYVIGLTATPNRSDGLEHILYWLAGPVGFVYQRLPSITGVSGTVIVKALEFRGGAQREVVYRNGNLGFANMMTLLSQDPARNQELQTLIRRALDERRRVLVVTSHVAHAKDLYDLNLDSVQAILAGSFQMPVEAKDPKTRLIFATYSLLEEGYDDPRLDALVLAMPRSKIQQTVGRIERTMEGKLVPIVYDLIDMFSLLPAMAAKRKSFFKSRGFTYETEDL